MLQTHTQLVTTGRKNSRFTTINQPTNYIHLVGAVAFFDVTNRNKTRKRVPYMLKLQRQVNAKLVGHRL